MDLSGTREFIRIFWPHWLGGLLLIGVWGYQLLSLMRDRPSEPDPANGYTIEIEINRQADVFISAIDAAWLAANFLALAAVVISGLWRVRKAQQKSLGALKP